MSDASHTSGASAASGPARAESSSIRAILARESAGSSVVLRGWLRTARHSKSVSFLEVHDGSCFAGIQAVAAPELSNYESVVRGLATGCAVEIEGQLVDSPGKGQRYEVHAERVELLGGVDVPVRVHPSRTLWSGQDEEKGLDSLTFSRDGLRGGQRRQCGASR